MKPRPYQDDAIAAVLEHLERHKSTLVVMPTGTGKTILFGHVLDRFKGRGRVMVLAHREELLAQAAHKIEAITGIRPDVEMALRYAMEGSMWHKSPVVVSSIQTQISGRQGSGRMTRFTPDEFSLLIIDEAHHAPAKSYRKIIDYYRQNADLRVLGVTATPDRHDKKALGQIFESVAYEYGILDAIQDGWLVPIRQQFVAVRGLNFTQCRTTAGDFNGRDLSQIMEYEKVLHGVVGPTIEIAADRKTLVFAASVAHAERMTEIFNRHSPGSSYIITGKSKRDERRSILRRYANGDFRYLVNVGVATEGFDMPDVDLIVIARPTKSRALYAQMIGRGTRPLTGILNGITDAEARRSTIGTSAKPDCLILDFAGVSGRHKLITTADILGGNYSEDVIAMAVRGARKGGGPVDMSEELKLALERKREADAQARAKRSRLVATAQYKTQEVSPFDVLHITPWRAVGYDSGRVPSEKMLDLLRRFGVDAPETLKYAEAKQLIGQLITRRKKGRATYKQTKLLRRYGYTHDMSFAEAMQLIDQIKGAGWKRPIKAAG